jgi:hypothetical protein
VRLLEARPSRRDASGRRAWGSWPRSISDGVPLRGSPAVPVGRVRRPNGRHTASQRDGARRGAGFRSHKRSSASRQEKCLLSGRLRARATLIAIQRSGAGQSRAVRQDRAQRAAQRRPLTARRSVATRCRFEHSPRRALQIAKRQQLRATWAASWTFTDPREQQERQFSGLRGAQRTRTVAT